MASDVPMIDRAIVLTLLEAAKKQQAAMALSPIHDDTRAAFGVLDEAISIASAALGVSTRDTVDLEVLQVVKLINEVGWQMYCTKRALSEDQPMSSVVAYWQIVESAVGQVRLTLESLGLVRFFRANPQLKDMEG